MEDKVLVLSKDGEWIELKNCFLVGALEQPDKVMYYKFFFTECPPEIRTEMLKKAEQYLADIKNRK